MKVGSVICFVVVSETVVVTVVSDAGVVISVSQTISDTVEAVVVVVVSAGVAVSLPEQPQDDNITAVIVRRNS